MKRLIILLLLFSSCVASRNFENVSLNGRYLTYKQVKLKLSTKTFGNVTLKGYISLTLDSSFCFRFYGPFSLEVVSGLFDSEFKVVDHVNNVKHDDALKQLQAKTGIVLNRRVFESLLEGKLGEVKQELENLNGSVLKYRLDDNKPSKELVIQSVARASQFILQCKYSGSIPRLIWIEYNDAIEKWSVQLDVINAGNDRKRCNFDF
jgi:hypothetical protein